MKRVAPVVLAFVVMLSAQPAWATRMPIHDAAESPQYGRKAGGMLGRGLLNVATCFVDLLVSITDETRKGPPLVGTLVGVGKGAGCMTLRALSGGVDVITFWVPGFNGMPVSDQYGNCLADSSGSSAEVTMPSTGESAWNAPAATPAPSSSMPAREEKPLYTK